jgi:carboxyl-terminal processing protease
LSRNPLLAVALAVVAFVAGVVVGGRSDGLEGLGDDLFGEQRGQLDAEALDVINDNYFHEVDDSQLENASVKAIVDELRKRYDDRFSHYFPPDAYSRFQDVTEGRFSGVGLSVTEVPRGLRVAMVFDDSPAKAAGIKPGDVITAVDGRSIAGQDSELSTARIKGKAGTEVTLTVLRPSTGDSRTLELKRAQVSLPVVEGSIKHVNGHPVAYVRLLGFSNGAGAALRDKVEQLYDNGAEGLVLDLRGNGGGLLTEAVLTSSIFVEDGTIVSTEGRTQDKQTFEAVGDALPERPIVVLINGDTASAAEILTAALSDAGLAETVGQRSFGKGTFQQVIPLDNGGALDLTIGQYLARDGESVNNTGIKPDVIVRDRPNAGGDEQLRRALAVLGSDLNQG